MEIFYIFKNIEFIVKERSPWTDQFWQDIKEIAITVLRFISDCEVEYSPKLYLYDLRKVESR